MENTTFIEVSKFGIPESFEHKLALQILSNFTKKNNSQKINYNYIEKQVKKIAKKEGDIKVNSFTPYVIAEIIEDGSVYSVFD